MSRYSVPTTKYLQKYVERYYAESKIILSEDDGSIYISGLYKQEDVNDLRMFGLGVYYALLDSGGENDV